MKEERAFLLYSPVIAEITVVRRGDVRRAKLYIICASRSGKSARIAEKAQCYDERADESAVNRVFRPIVPGLVPGLRWN